MPAIPPDQMVEAVCGNCKFSREANEEQIACFGVPPTPVVVGQMSGPPGTPPQIRIDALRPVIGKTQPACSLHQRRLLVDLTAGKNGFRHPN